MSVLFVFTLVEKVITNRYVAFAFLALLQVIFLLVMYWMIDEVNVLDDREERRQKKKSMWGKLYSNLK